jgi:ABC-type proline/glycine betaine transport system permease subunit
MQLEAELRTARVMAAASIVATIPALALMVFGQRGRRWAR